MTDLRSIWLLWLWSMILSSPSNSEVLTQNYFLWLWLRHKNKHIHICKLQTFPKPVPRDEETILPIMVEYSIVTLRRWECIILSLKQWKGVKMIIQWLHFSSVEISLYEYLLHWRQLCVFKILYQIKMSYNESLCKCQQNINCLRDLYVKWFVLISQILKMEPCFVLLSFMCILYCSCHLPLLIKIKNATKNRQWFWRR